MKIMFDATCLARKKTGIENYTKNLLEQLVNVIDKKDRLYILFRDKLPKGIKYSENITILLCPIKSQILCEQLWIPIMKLKYKPDVIHFPAFPPPYLLRGNILFTVHDATMWKYGNTLSIKNKLYMKPLSENGIKKAKKIITVSETSKRELMNVFPNIKNKFENLGISISPKIKRVTELESLEKVKRKYKLPHKFILTVGSLEPRKNLIFLIESFYKFSNENKMEKIKLVITGRSAWGAKELNKYIELKNMKDKVIMTGYVPDSDLVCLYSLSDCFIFPSLYEGFGLPVLEAMTCGCPVVSSNSSSLPEVGGDAPLYFDPTDEKDLVKQLKYLINNDLTKFEMVKRGIEQSKKFSWMKITNNIYNLYKESLK